MRPLPLLSSLLVQTRSVRLPLMLLSLLVVMRLPLLLLLLRASVHYSEARGCSALILPLLLPTRSVRLPLLLLQTDSMRLR